MRKRSIMKQRKDNEILKIRHNAIIDLETQCVVRRARTPPIKKSFRIEILPLDKSSAHSSSI